MSEKIESQLGRLDPLVPRRGSKRQLYLNPDFAYLLWVKYKSLEKAAAYLREHGMESYNGKPYTRQGIHYAAMRSNMYKQAQREISSRRKAAIRKIQKDVVKES